MNFSSVVFCASEPFEKDSESVVNLYSIAIDKKNIKIDVSLILERIYLLNRKTRLGKAPQTPILLLNSCAL